MSTTEKKSSETKKIDIKEMLLEFEGFTWWQSVLIGLIVFLFFSSFTTSWMILFPLGVFMGFITGKQIKISATITAGCLALSWSILFLLNMIFSGFRTLEVADAFLFIATGVSGIGMIFFIIALLFALALGGATGALGAALFQEWELFKTRFNENENQ